MSSRVISEGCGQSPKGTALGANVCQPPCSSLRGLPPRQGTSVEAFRPACASWMAARAPCDLMKEAMGSKARACSSDQRPVSPGEMRPSGETAVASTQTSPAPPTARLPR